MGKKRSPASRVIRMGKGRWDGIFRVGHGRLSENQPQAICRGEVGGAFPATEGRGK